MGVGLTGVGVLGLASTADDVSAPPSERVASTYLPDEKHSLIVNVPNAKPET